jgi:hypothetical protein
MSLNSLGAKMPQYPGRKALERVLGPLVAPVAARGAGSTIQRLLGFWAMQATYGGDLSGLVERGFYSRAGVWKSSTEFRDLFGCDVADFLPEIADQLYQSGLAVKIGHPEAVAPRKVPA